MSINFKYKMLKKPEQLLQLIWVIGLMESWFCIWDDLANPKNGLNFSKTAVGQNVVRYAKRTLVKK
jgi:hypothetical protein